MLSNRLLCFPVAAALAVAGDHGVTPRPNTADYAAHQASDSVTLAASIVPSDQVRKIFSPDIARNYVVVECAFYPADGHSVDIDRFGFSLKTGPDAVAHAETPRGVATPWPEKTNPVEKNSNVTTESGVYVAHTSAPGGHQTETGTWQSVAVGDGRRNAPPPPPPDRPGLEAKLSDRALPEGSTRVTVAGYLYFPRYPKKHKNDATELIYSNDDLTLDLTFPK